MVKIALGFIPLIIACMLISCINDGAPIYEKQLNGPYYLDANDEYKEMAISIQDRGIGVGVIKATVFAIGQTNEFIIAKQHPLDERRNIDKSKINYFIIPLKQKISKAIDDNYWGPLSLSDFNKKSHELNMGTIPFTVVFSDLE